MSHLVFAGEVLRASCNRKTLAATLQVLRLMAVLSIVTAFAAPAIARVLQVDVWE